MIYAIAAFVAYLWLTDWKIPRRETQDQSGYSAASGTEYSESDANSEDQPEANADEVESEPEQAEAEADTRFVVSEDRKSDVWGTRVSVRLNLGGRTDIKQKK